MEYRPGSVVFENWTLTKLLGQGANGKVFQIEKNSFGVKTCSALKVIRIPQSSSDIKDAMSEGMDERSVTEYFYGFVEEIVKEIAVMTSLKGHPHIVGYEDHCVIPHEDEIGWDILIRMELLTTLTDHQLKAPMDEQEVLRLGVEMAEALEFCQSKGLIHRDIKPQNVFVSQTGQYKLGDFGVARTVEKTRSGLSRKGTESYMAPEVYKNEEYGPSVDIYSLGLMLYTLMNHGRLPFYPAAPAPIRYEDRERAMRHRMGGEPIPFVASASRAFGEVIRKACEYDPKKRYRTASELKAALRAVQSGRTSCAKTVRDVPPNAVDPEWLQEDTNEFEDKTISIWDTDPETKQKGKRTDPQTVVTPPTQKTVQKKKGKGGILLFLIVACLAVGGVATLLFGGEKEGPSDEENKPPQTQAQDQRETERLPQGETSDLIILDGSGSGTYCVGDMVTVTAEPPAGYVFVYWLKGYNDVSVESAYKIEQGYESAKEFLGDVTASSVTFSMPERQMALRAYCIPQQQWERQQQWEDFFYRFLEDTKILGEPYESVAARAYAQSLETGDWSVQLVSGNSSDMNAQVLMDGKTREGFIEYREGKDFHWRFWEEDWEAMEIVKQYAPSPLGIQLGQPYEQVIHKIGLTEDAVNWIIGEEEGHAGWDDAERIHWTAEIEETQTSAEWLSISVRRGTAVNIAREIDLRFVKGADGEYYLQAVYIRKS